MGFADIFNFVPTVHIIPIIRPLRRTIVFVNIEFTLLNVRQHTIMTSATRAGEA